MNKAAIIAIVVLVVLLGGLYAYDQRGNSSPAPAAQEPASDPSLSNLKMY